MVSGEYVNMPNPSRRPRSTSTPHADLIDGAWEDVLDFLPAGLDELAKEEIQFRRRGAVQAASDLLRIGMAYAVLVRRRGDSTL